MVVIGLGKNLLLKSVLGHCVLGDISDTWLNGHGRAHIVYCICIVRPVKMNGFTVLPPHNVPFSTFEKNKTEKAFSLQGCGDLL